MSRWGSTTMASRDSRDATKYEAQPVSSCKNCLKYIGVDALLEGAILWRVFSRVNGVVAILWLAMRRRAVLLLVLIVALAVPLVALAQEAAPAGYPGQSNTVPDGFPTPTTAFQRLMPGGPARDPRPFDWAIPGQYIEPNWTDFTVTSFSSQQYLATTYYFYWHDLTDPTRLARQQGRFHTPPDPAHYSFLLPETHQREFQDMQAAGLDFVLPVYWGEPGHPGRTTAETSPHYWSTEGIPAMVRALDNMQAQGNRPFK